MSYYNKAARVLMIGTITYLANYMVCIILPVAEPFTGGLNHGAETGVSIMVQRHVSLSWCRDRCLYHGADMCLYHGAETRVSIMVQGQVSLSWCRDRCLYHGVETGVSIMVQRHVSLSWCSLSRKKRPMVSGFT